MKTTHTHRGHCQICGAIQALNNISGTVAKHGYTTTWGYFNGTCPGSDKLSLHIQRSLTDELIAHLNTNANHMDGEISAYRDGLIFPAEVVVRYELRTNADGSKSHQPIFVKWAEATQAQRALAVDELVSNLKMRAQGNRDYAMFLAKLAIGIFDKVAPFPTKAKVAPLAVGDMTTRGEILEIATQVARGCGPYMNGRHIPHARLKGVSGNDYWWPVRTLKRPKV